MRRVVGLIAAGLLLASGGAAGGAPSMKARAAVSPEAMSVLTAAMKTMDRFGKLGRIHVSKWTWSEVRRGKGPERYGEETMLLREPDSLLRTVDSESESGEMGIEAGKPWSALGAPPAHCRGAAAKRIEERLLLLKLFLIHPILEDPGLSVSLGKGTEAAPVVVVTTRSGLHYELGFTRDGDTVTLTSLKGDRTRRDGSRGRLEMAFSEPKKLSGLELPTKIVQRLDPGPEPGETLEQSLSSIEWNPKLPAHAFRMPAPKMEFGVPGTTEVPAMKTIVVAHGVADAGIAGSIDKTIRQMTEWKLRMLGPVIAVYRDSPAGGANAGELRADLVVPISRPAGGSPLPEGVEYKESPPRKAASIVVRGEYGTVEAKAIRDLEGWIEEKQLLPIGAPRCVYEHDPDQTVPADQIAEIEIPISRTR